jgi:hypothetical protein
MASTSASVIAALTNSSQLVLRGAGHSVIVGPFVPTAKLDHGQSYARATRFARNAFLSRNATP